MIPVTAAGLGRGTLLLARFELLEPIATGGSGTLWRARDGASGAVVAAKVLARAGPAWQREVAALGSLRIAGVPELVDHGEQDGHAVVVMQYVEGVRLGELRPRPWAEVKPLVLGLLEILIALHGAGLVHGDVKPDNVVVGADGLPRLVDFGLVSAEGACLGPGCGTPGFVAPEQWRGEPLDRRADLFGLGRLLGAVVGGDLPPPVHETVRRLTSASREARPASGEDVILALEGAHRPAVPAWVIPTDVVERVCAALAIRKQVRIGGPPGCGRSRAVADVADRLAEQGIPHRRVPPSRVPYGSLDPLPVDIAPHVGFEDARASVVDALRGNQDGTVFLCDGEPDPWTADALRSAGLRLVSVVPGEGDVDVRPWGVDELVPLFQGHEPVFDVPRRAARELYRRTRGVAALVQRELGRWSRRGMTTSLEGRVGVDPARIALLERELVAPGAAAAEPLPVPEGLRELLAYGWFAWPEATVAGTAAVLGQPRWWIEAGLGALVRGGHVVRQGEVWATVRGLDLGAWSPGERADWQVRVARSLAGPAPERLSRWLAADAVDEAVAEAVGVVHREIVAGRPFEGCRWAEVTWRAGRGRVASDLMDALLDAWAQAAVTARTPAVLGAWRVAARLRGWADGRVALVDAVLEDLRSPDATRLVERLRGLEGEGWVGLWSLQLAALASARISADSLREATKQLGAWAEATGSADGRATHAHLRGRMAYQSGEFRAAAEHHARAAGLARTASARLSSRLDEAAALLELAELDAVLARAGEVVTEATDGRHHTYATVGWWLRRAATYRSGRGGRADADLAAAVDHVGVPWVAALVHLQEAAFAWRAGEPATGGRLALVAAERAGDLPDALSLARSLAWACGAPSTPAERDVLVQDALDRPPAAVAVQVAALASAAGPLGGWRDRALARAEEVPREAWSHRRECLSLDEAVALLQ